MINPYLLKPRRDNKSLADGQSMISAAGLREAKPRARREIRTRSSSIRAIFDVAAMLYEYPAEGFVLILF